MVSFDKLKQLAHGDKTHLTKRKHTSSLSNFIHFRSGSPIPHKREDIVLPSRVMQHSLAVPTAGLSPPSPPTSLETRPTASQLPIVENAICCNLLLISSYALTPKCRQLRNPASPSPSEPIQHHAINLHLATRMHTRFSCPRRSWSSGTQSCMLTHHLRSRRLLQFPSLL